MNKEKLVLSKNETSKNGADMWNIIMLPEIPEETADTIGFVIRHENNFFVIGINEKQFDLIKKGLPLSIEDKESVYNIFISENYNMFNICNKESEFYKECFSECEEY